MLELEQDEQIIATGEKNKLLYRLCFLSCLSIFLATVFIAVKIFHECSNIALIIVLITSPVWIYLLLDGIRNYCNRQIYLTNKRILIDDKNNLTVINFDDFNYYTEEYKASIIYTKSGLKYKLVLTNIDKLANEFLRIYPQYERKKESKKNILVETLTWMFVFLLAFGAGKAKNTPYCATTDVYIKTAETKIIQHWNRPETANNYVTAVDFDVLRNGKIINEKITQSSGNAEFDESAIEAVKTTRKLPILPIQHQPKGIVKMHFLFR